MAQQRRQPYTPAEYLALEEIVDHKSEYLRGEIFAMAGGSQRHNLIAGNIFRALGNALETNPCQVYIFDMRLLVKSNGLCTYPDIMAICGSPEFVEGRSDTVTNPLLIVEVLCPSTREYDRVRMFGLYQALATLQEYVLADSEAVHVTCLSRFAGSHRWLVEMHDNLDETLVLESVGCRIPLRQIYGKVDLGAAG